jgi:hypothetical protein
MSLKNEITKILELEILKKQIEEYFINNCTIDENEELATHKINPILLANLPFRVAPLSNLVEVIPHIKEINMSNGEIIIGWNFFIDGINRLYLGSTKFEDFNKMIQAIKNGNDSYVVHFNPAYRIQDIINFILDTISTQKLEIDINSKPIQDSFYGKVGDAFLKSVGSPGMMGKMYAQNRTVN